MYHSVIVQSRSQMISHFFVMTHFSRWCHDPHFILRKWEDQVHARQRRKKNGAYLCVTCSWGVTNDCVSSAAATAAAAAVAHAAVIAAAVAHAAGMAARVAA